LEISDQIGGSGVTVTKTSAEQGLYTFNSNGATGSFNQIEELQTTDNNDSVVGSSGDEVFFLEDGADTIDAGAGDDTIDLGASDGDADRIILQDGDGSDTITGFAAPIDNGDGTYTGLDTFDVTGLTDAGGNPVNVFDVTVTDDGSGNAVLTFPGGESATLIGVDPIYAAQYRVLMAMGIPPSDGTVSGSAGDDVIDTAYTGDPDGDRVDANDAITFGASGNDDIIEAGSGNDTVLAGDGNDTVMGGDGNDQIFGGSGNDQIDQGFGDDVIYAGDGDDIISSFAMSGSDTIYAGSGNDFVQTGFGNSDSAEIYAGDGDDFIADNGGFTSNDIFDGGAGNDNILGGEGNDTIIGGSGDDTVNGFAGDDTFVLEDGFGTDIIDGAEFLETSGDVVDASAITTDSTLTFEVLGGEEPTDPGDPGDPGGPGGPGDPGDPGGPGGPGPGPGPGPGGGGVSGPGATFTTGFDTASTVGIEHYDLGSGNDLVLDDENANSVNMGGGDDTFQLSDGYGNDTVVGGEANETSGDFLDASALTESVTITNTGPDASTMTNASGQTLSFAEIEELETGSGNDDIDAGSGVDVIRSGAGDDTVTGGAGADSLDGGTGFDVLDYSDSATGVNVDLSDALAESGGDAQGDVISRRHDCRWSERRQLRHHRLKRAEQPGERKLHWPRRRDDHRFGDRRCDCL